MNNGFTPEEIAFYREILDKFPGDKRIKSETTADVLCTGHDDHNPSLGVDLGLNGAGAKVLVNCRSQGCDIHDVLETIGLSAKELYFANNGHSKQKKSSGELPLPGCTLKEYTAYKNLPIEFLTADDIGLENDTYYCSVAKKKIPAVYIPYAEEYGDEVERSSRWRTGLNKTTPDTRMRHLSKKQGGELMLYGLWRLEEARESNYVLLVEGESDCHVLWYHGLPALGIPGAKNWRDEWANHLDDIATILVAVEPDNAGSEMFSKLAACARLYPRLEKVRFADAV